MSPLLDSAPSHWTRTRIKFVSSLKGRLGWQGLKADEYRDDGPHVVSSAHFRDGRIVWRMCPRVSEDRYRLDANIQLESGDVLLMKDGAAMGKLAFVDCLPGPACLNSHLLLFRPTNRAYVPRYLYYLLGTPFFQGYIAVNGTGATFLGISQKSVGDFSLALPTVETQQAIADFLDGKTAAIDALIAKKERLIELLEEKRQALITQAVTKGLDPTVPMKDSGIEWLGEIPAHWELWTVRNLVRSGEVTVQDGNHGELHPVAADYVDDGIPFVMANNVRDERVRMDECKRLPKDLTDGLRIGFARSGDVLLTHKGTVGEAAIIPDDLQWPYLMLTPQVTYYRSRGRFLNARFLLILFRSAVVQQQLRLIAGHQSTRAYVGLTAQRDLVLPVPPLHEQRRIEEEVSPTRSMLHDLVHRAGDSLEQLREYRQALITSAVTGQIEVPS